MIPVLPILTAAAGAVGKVLRAIPPMAWVALAALFAAFVYGEVRYRNGADSVRLEYEARQLVEDKQAAEFQAEQADITVQTVTEYVDRVKVVKEKGETIRELVPVYVPMVELAGGFRLLHDAAASGVLPPAPGSVPAEPVDSQTVARTVTDNYTACRAELTKAQSLWEWSVKQARLGEKGETNGNAQ